MLVIEGADDLGKTTAAKRLTELANEHGVARMLDREILYTHMSRPAPDFDFGVGYKSMIQRHYVRDRFHLGSLVWHNNVMTPAKMSVIEGQIRLIGGLVVIFYTTDLQWYDSVLSSSSRPQMFDKKTILRANGFYKGLAQADANYVSVEVDGESYADESDLMMIIEMWMERLEFSRKWGDT